MNPIFLTIILIPVIEIYLLIKIGSQIGAITTILLIFTTAIVGIYQTAEHGPAPRILGGTRRAGDDGGNLRVLLLQSPVDPFLERLVLVLEVAR